MNEKFFKGVKRLRLLLSIILPLVLILETMYGYAAYETINSTNVQVTGVKLSKTALPLIVGKTAKLKATVAPYSATNKNVTWETSDDSVAKVDEKGYVTAVEEGTATIVATTVDGAYSAECEVTVTAIHVTEVKLNKTTLSLKIGKTAKLKAKVMPYKATNKNVIWETSDESVATVDENGCVAAADEGTATIVVTSEDGDITAECEVTVVPIKVIRLIVDKPKLELNEGDTYLLKTSVVPKNASNQTVMYSSDNEDVAIVDEDGQITAVAAGNAIITATSEDGNKTALCRVIVKGQTISAEGIKLNKTAIKLSEGAVETLVATVEPSNATNKTVTYTSSNSAVATVDNAGQVIAKAAGNATITVKTADGGKTATCGVTVVTSVAGAIPVTGVKLNKTALKLNVGAAETLVATIEPSNATNKAVTFISSNGTVALVDNTGKVTGKAPGNAIITAKAVDGGEVAICEVTVVIPVTGVRLNKSSLTLNVGAAEALIATVEPSNATNKAVTYTSSDSAVASVDNDGQVIARAEGNAIITVKTADGGKTATCGVTVVIPATGVRLNKTTLSLDMGTAETLVATVEPSNATNKTVTYTSSDSVVAAVDNDGQVIAKSPGNAIITVKTADGWKIATCTVTVIAHVTGVRLNKSSLTLNVGAAEALIATVEPSNATNKTVTYTSSNSAVATVDNDGQVIARAEGNAIITVKTADGGKTATCGVTVVVPVTGVRLNKTALTLNIGASETLVATVEPSNATNKTVTYTSSNSAVATVDNDGQVIAKSPGNAIITVKTADGWKIATCTVTVSMSPAIFYIPHTGDETVYMAPSILEHVRGGRKVILVLLTDGAASSAKADINGVDDNNAPHVCNLHGRIHNPSAEGYLNGTLDKSEFVAARIKEFKEAAAAMGIPAENIFINNFADGALTVDQVKSVISSYEAKYPKASHKVMTYRKDLEKHPDHYNCGQAALELYNTKVVSDVRFYVRSDFWNAAGTLPLSSITATGTDATKLQGAITVYKTWAPSQGKYEIGYHSDKPTFDALSTNMTSKYHQPGL